MSDQDLAQEKIRLEKEIGEQNEKIAALQDISAFCQHKKEERVCAASKKEDQDELARLDEELENC
jgi:hypothetical protein